MQWNSNGLQNRILELKLLLKQLEIDIIAISETHETNKTHLKIPYYTYLRHTTPQRKSTRRIGNLHKNNIKYVQPSSYQTDKIQATTVNITQHNRDVNISAIYCSPKQAISTEEFNKFFKSYKTKFIALGYLNAKHNHWGSRTNNPKGKNLYQCIKINNLKIYAPGRPTNLPSDPKKYRTS